MANNQQQQPLPTRQGPIDRVPCPWCGKPNDFRLLQEQMLLDTGHRCDCDYCHQSMEVAAIRPVVMVAVRQDHKPRDRRQVQAGAQQQVQRRQVAAQQQQPQRGIGGFVRNLLGGGPKR